MTCVLLYRIFIKILGGNTRKPLNCHLDVTGYILNLNFIVDAEI